MKGYFSLLLGSLIVVLMLVSPGNAVQAAEKVSDPTHENCGCPVTPILGAEGNKWVSNLLKDEAFQNTKMELKEDGYKWNGANEIEVVRWNANGMILARAPFINEEGIIEYAGFRYLDGVFQFGGIAPDTEQ